KRMSPRNCPSKTCASVINQPIRCVPSWACVRNEPRPSRRNYASVSSEAGNYRIRSEDFELCDERKCPVDCSSPLVTWHLIGCQATYDDLVRGFLRSRVTLRGCSAQKKLPADQRWKFDCCNRASGSRTVKMTGTTREFQESRASVSSRD